jgi:phosphoribosylformimino-5-aminoimidazole carboxamide ribotide isomerase
VIVGTRGIEDPAWLREQATLAPGRLILAADVRDRAVVAKGWATSTNLQLADILSELEDVPLAALLVTAVHKEGKLEGTDLPLIEEAVRSAAWPVIAAGGVGSMQDLRNLEDRGVAAAVIGMGLYTDALDARVVAEEFAA